MVLARKEIAAPSFLPDRLGETHCLQIVYLKDRDFSTSTFSPRAHHVCTTQSCYIGVRAVGLDAGT
jgi:hypothetical protein